MVEAAKISSESLGEYGELNPQLDIDDAVVAKHTIENCRIVGILLIHVRIFSPFDISQDPMLSRRIHKEVLQRFLRSEGNLLCVLSLQLCVR